jgi:hypothetical protein
MKIFDSGMVDKFVQAERGVHALVYFLDIRDYFLQQSSLPAAANS